MGRCAVGKIKSGFYTKLASYIIAESHRAQVENFRALPSSHEPRWIRQW